MVYFDSIVPGGLSRLFFGRRLIASDERYHLAIRRPCEILDAAWNRSETFSLRGVNAHHIDLNGRLRIYSARFSTVGKKRQPTPIRRPAWRSSVLKVWY